MKISLIVDDKHTARLAKVLNCAVSIPEVTLALEKHFVAVVTGFVKSEVLAEESAKVNIDVLVPASEIKIEGK